MAKGIELPVNVLVIVAIAVIVLIGLIVLLGAGLLGANPIFIELEKANACAALKQSELGCKEDPVKITVSTKTGYTDLWDICQKYFKPAIADKGKCKIQACSCSAASVA